MFNQTRYVYICSAGHSGSTLLDLLLGSHSRVESLGEILHLSKNIALNTPCSCGKPLRSCPVWEQVVSILNEQLQIDIFSDPYSLHMGFPNPQVIKDSLHDSLHYKFKRKILKGLRYLELRYRMKFLEPLLCPIYNGIENTVLVYEAIRQVLQCQVVIDSSKSYLEAVGIYKKNPASTRILLLTRDGRGVLYSNLNRNYSRDKSLRGWKNHYERALTLLNMHVHPNHILRVRYEDVVRDTAKEIERICQFIGITFEEDMLNFTSHVHHITNGNDMRFLKTSKIKEDNVWQHKLSETDREAFDRKAGSLNRSLGYA